MRLMPTLSLLVLTSLAAACGSVRATPDSDAGSIDGGLDDGPSPTDAAPDAPTDAPPLPPPPPGTARELAVSAGTVRDPRFVLQLELTGGIAPRTATGAAVTLESATTVTVPRGGN